MTLTPILSARNFSQEGILVLIPEARWRISLGHFDLHRNHWFRNLGNRANFEQCTIFLIPKNHCHLSTRASTPTTIRAPGELLMWSVLPYLGYPQGLKPLYEMLPQRTALFRLIIPNGRDWL